MSFELSFDEWKETTKARVEDYANLKAKIERLEAAGNEVTAQQRAEVVAAQFVYEQCLDYALDIAR